MSVLAWKCRGLGCPRIVQELKSIITKKQPQFVFIMETKIDRARADGLKASLGYENLFYVNNRGLSGGLALFWKGKNVASLISYSSNHIDISVNNGEGGEWRLTGFYGFPSRRDRQKSWDLLCTLKDKSDLPWLVIGDFKDLTCQKEKKGGRPHPTALLHGFADALDQCGLFDLGMHGYAFTWEKGRRKDNWVEERLDRAVASNSWRLLFKNARLENVNTVCSDHSALWLNLDSKLKRGPEKLFRFENAWLKDEECLNLVADYWKFVDKRTSRRSSWSVVVRWNNEVVRNINSLVEGLTC